MRLVRRRRWTPPSPPSRSRPKAPEELDRSQVGRQFVAVARHAWPTSGTVDPRHSQHEAAPRHGTVVDRTNCLDDNSWQAKRRLRDPSSIARSPVRGFGPAIGRHRPGF